MSKTTHTPVPLLDLKAQYRSIKTEIEAAVAEVFESQRFVLGPEVQECEQAVAAYCGCAHGAEVSSGTDALLISSMAEEIGPGHEVITTPYTFFATAGSIARTGARPVFVDIDPVTYNVNPELIEEKVTPQTCAIIPVHLFGQMADMDAIMESAQRHNLVVIEDAAQAIGAEYKGRRAGSIGHYGCFSFFPSKNLGGAGDGGMVVTQDEGRAERVRVLRGHGAKPKYYHKLVGGNFRLDALQAAVINVKLKYLDQWTAARQANAARYCQLFQRCNLTPDIVKLPVELPDRRHIYNQFVVHLTRRDELREFLAGRAIGTEIYYPVPMHVQDCFADLGYRRGDFPESETAATDTLALPIYPELTDEQIHRVVESMTAFYSDT